MTKQNQPKVYNSPIGDDVLDKLRDVRRRLCELRDETQEIIETLAELDHLEAERQVEEMRSRFDEAIAKADTTSARC